MRPNAVLSRAAVAAPSAVGGGGGGGEVAARASSRTVTAKQVYLNKSRYVAGQNTRNAQYGECLVYCPSSDSGSGTVLPAGKFYNWLVFHIFTLWERPGGEVLVFWSFYLFIYLFHRGFWDTL